MEVNSSEKRFEINKWISLDKVTKDTIQVDRDQKVLHNAQNVVTQLFGEERHHHAQDLIDFLQCEPLSSVYEPADDIIDDKEIVGTGIVHVNIMSAVVFQELKSYKMFYYIEYDSRCDKFFEIEERLQLAVNAMKIQQELPAHQIDHFYLTFRNQIKDEMIEEARRKKLFARYYMQKSDKDFTNYEKVTIYPNGLLVKTEKVKGMVGYDHNHDSESEHYRQRYSNGVSNMPYYGHQIVNVNPEGGNFICKDNRQNDGEMKDKTNGLQEGYSSENMIQTTNFGDIFQWNHEPPFGSTYARGPPT